MKNKFESQIEFVWNGVRNKFIPLSADTPNENNTFCLDNKMLNILLGNDENCRFFNIKTGGKQDWWWAYAYNLMFQAIDFDWDTDIWLCKVIGYLE